MSLKEDQRKAVRPEEIKSGEHDDLGVHPERKEAEVDDLENLYNQESRDDADRNTNPDESTKSEQDSLPNNTINTDGDDDGSGWSNKVRGKKAKGKSRFSGRRLAIGGGSTGLLLGLGIGLSIFLSGPLRIIHAAMLLDQFHTGSSTEFSSRRVSKLLRYAKKFTGIRGTTGMEDFNLSRAGNKLAVHYEKGLSKKGIGFDYDHGHLKTITIDPNSEAGARYIKKIEEKHGVSPPIGEDGRVRLELAPNSAEVTDIPSRRIAVNDAIESTGMGKINQAMAKRLLKKRARLPSMFHPIERFKAKYDEKFWLKYEDWKKAKNADADKKITTGDVEPDINTKNPVDAETGNPTSADDIAGGVAEIQAEAKAKVPLKEKLAGLKAKLAKPAGAIALLGMFCGLDALGEGVSQLQESNVVLPSIRLAMSMVITPAGQIMRGDDISMMDLAPITEKYFDNESKTDFFSAESIQYNLGKPDTGVPIADSAKPGRARPAFFEIIHKVVSGTPGLTATCGAITSGFGMIVTTVLDFALAIASGGASVAVTAASTAGGFIISDMFGEDILKSLAGKVIDINELKGGAFGAVADSGAFLADNNTMMALGGRALTPTENQALINENNLRIKQESQKKPVYARLFNIKDPRSLVSTALIDNSKLQNTQIMANSLVSSPFKILNYFGSTLSSLNPRAYAQTTPYDYGVDKFGFSAQERDSAITEDPYENEAEIHDRLEQLNIDYGECFGTTIDPATGKFKTTEAKSYVDLEKIKGKCGPNNTDPDYLRYRMYLADSVLMATATCYEGVDEESCADLDIGNAAAQNANQADAVANNNIVVGDTSSLTCTVGVDGGVGDGYTDNKLYKIRLCTVGNGEITVNAQIAEAIDKLVADAKTAGINLGGDGFRSMKDQVALRTKNGCPDTYTSPSSSCNTPTARPGFSNHQMGLAIDFNQGGASLSKNMSGFSWLQANASKYGLKNLPSEPWHWSVDGH